MKVHAPMFCDSSWHQTNFCACRNGSSDCAQLFFRQRIKLLQPNDRRGGDFLLLAMIQEIVVDFARAKNDALDFLRRRHFRRRQNFRETVRS